MADRFQHLNSVEAETPKGIWSWSKRLIDELNKLVVEGLVGYTGPQGKSAYQVAVDNGFVGTEAAWLTSLEGADGAPGAPGTNSQLAIFQEQKPNNMAGGTSVSGSWLARALNAVVHNNLPSASLVSSAVTITIASPGVVSWVGHGLANGTAIILATTGALPTGLTAGTTYYVVSAAADTFSLAASSGGAAINTSGSQSGTHTAYAGQVSLAAGTYRIRARATFFTSNIARVRIRDVTNNVVLALSDNSYGSNVNGGMALPEAVGVAVLAGTARLQVEYRVQIGVATNGLGVLANFTELETYNTLEIEKLI